MGTRKLLTINRVTVLDMVRLEHDSRKNVTSAADCCGKKLVRKVRILLRRPLLFKTSYEDSLYPGADLLLMSNTIINNTSKQRIVRTKSNPFILCLSNHAT